MRGTVTRYVAPFVIFQLLAACSPEPERQQAPAPSTEAPAPAAENLVLLFGDSLYAGYGLPQGEGLAPELERALVTRGLSVEVVNGGVSGDTSAAGLQRLAFTLDGLPRAPDLVLLGLGGNDMLRGLAPQQTRANLDAILDELSRRNIPVMLTGMLAAPNLGVDYAAAFNPIYPELANARGLKLYPFILEGVVARPELMLDDMIHPNEKGIDLIAARLAPHVAAEID